MSIIDVTQTVCDRCGDETPVMDTSPGLDTWPEWAGATLCPDCWAVVEGAVDMQRIPWQRFKVSGGQIALNEAGQYSGRLHIFTDDSKWSFTLSFVFEQSGASWGWTPVEPTFTPNIVEE